MSKEALIKTIDAEREHHIAFLQSIIHTPSSNPPGDTREAIKVVEKYINDFSIDTEIIAPLQNSPNLVSVLTGGDDKITPGPRLVMNGHIDAFPVNDQDEWQRDPFSSDIENGFIHGRGVVDMKAGTAASIIAFTYLHRYRSELSGTCALEVVSDEETGGKFGTRYLLEQDDRKEVWKGDCVLNAEPVGLNSIRFCEKGTLRMTFTVRTRGGHGAYIHRDEGAVRVASRIIDRLVGLEDLRGEGMDPALRQYLQRHDVQKVADDIMGKGAADSMLKPTINIGTIQGGVKVNMIPPTCVFEADIRLPIGLVAKTVLARIDEIIADIPEASYVVQEAATNPAAASPIDHKLVRLLQKNAKSVHGVTPLPISSLGATDCKHFRYHGVPAYTYGPSPDTMAEKDERVSIQEFLDIVKVHTLTAWDFLGGVD